MINRNPFHGLFFLGGEETNGPDVGLHNKKKLQQRGKGARKKNKQNRWK